MGPEGILSLLPFFESDHCKLDYNLITLLVNNKKKGFLIREKKKKDELSNE